MGKADPIDEAKVPDHAGGYTPSGSSQWSRIKAGGFDPDVAAKPKAPRRHLSAAGLLLDQEDRLARLYRALPTATGEKLQKLLRDEDAKLKFIARLKKEIEAT